MPRLTQRPESTCRSVDPGSQPFGRGPAGFLRRLRVHPVLLAVVASLLLAGFGGSPATLSGSTGAPGHAALLHPLAATISLSSTNGKPGTTVKVTGSGFASGATITITFDGVQVTTSPDPCVATSGTGKGGGGGTFSCSFQVPKGSAGPNTVSATDGSSAATATFNEKDLVSASPRSVDVGQNGTAAGAGFGDDVSITAFTLDGIALNCTAASAGSSCTSGATTTNATGGFNITFVAPSVSASATYPILANDSSGNDWSGNVTVYLDPSVGSITPSTPSVDLGGEVTFSATAANGSGGYTFVWSGLPGCSGGSDPLACTPSVPGATAIIQALP